MEWTCRTQYNVKTLTMMSRVMRKTLRKRFSRGAHLFSYVVMAMCLLSIWVRWGEWGEVALHGVIFGLLLLLRLGEDWLNGYLAYKQKLPGMDDVTTVFRQDGYEGCMAGATTKWSYDAIQTLAETEHYFVFLLNKTYAQAYDKRQITGGGVDQLREFLYQKTGKQIQYIK